ncbi:MAG TPA: LLM class flavin-dependent oxidoreductase, partial [Tepidisphaeraceae bacterium]|nr:LLM class flavin-dependent oxidoreductase [Tepidisphaeraceae bacterium]
MFQIGITDHLEGPAERASAQIYDEVQDLVLLADSLGIEYFWFAEHHAHAHHGHLAAPLLLALHLAGRTRQIRLGTAIICLNLHHPLDVAEQVAIADELSGGRLSVGFGSGSTPQEFALFGLPETSDEERHARFAEALRIILQVWSGGVTEMDSRFFQVPPHSVLKVARPDLHSRSWLAVNSETSARIAGELGFGMLFSHLRTPEQYRQYTRVYRAAGGKGLIAANRPVYVGRTDADAFGDVEPALRTLWRRFRDEGKIAATVPEPRSCAEL